LLKFWKSLPIFIPKNLKIETLGLTQQVEDTSVGARQWYLVKLAWEGTKGGRKGIKRA
jgi:hypothetical protein